MINEANATFVVSEETLTIRFLSREAEKLLNSIQLGTQEKKSLQQFFPPNLQKYLAEIYTDTIVSKKSFQRELVLSETLTKCIEYRMVSTPVIK